MFVHCAAHIICTAFARLIRVVTRQVICSFAGDTACDTLVCVLCALTLTAATSGRRIQSEATALHVGAEALLPIAMAQLLHMITRHFTGERTMEQVPAPLPQKTSKTQQANRRRQISASCESENALGCVKSVEYASAQCPTCSSLDVHPVPYHPSNMRLVIYKDRDAHRRLMYDSTTVVRVPVR